MKTLRKPIAILLTALMLCALFASCGNQASNQEGNQEGNQENEVPVVEKEKELVIVIGGVPKLLDPAKYSSTYESYIVYNVCNTLVSYSSDMTEIVPCLGELKSTSEDGLCYTFTIRDDVYFHPGKFQDGRKMTAEDVKYSLERSAKESAMDRLTMLDHCEIISDTEIACYLKSPDATFLTFLTDTGNSIVPKEEVEGQGDAFSQYVIGTGPYMVKEFVPDQEVVLVKNEKYWAQEPALDKVTYKVITDNNQAANSLLAGESHLALNLSGEALTTIQQTEGVNLMEAPQLGFTYLSFNMKNGITSDIRVRQALSMAIDVDELIAGIYPFTSVTRNYLPVPTGSWGYSEDLVEYVPKFDPEAARELLKGTEYENGFEVHFYHSNNDVRVKMATILQEQLKNNLNVTLVDHVSDFATFTEVTQAGNAEMGTVSWSWFADPYFFLNSFFHSNATGTLGGGSCMQLPEVDALLDKAALNGTLEERKAIYHDAIKLILEQYPGLYFVSTNISWAVADEVEGVVIRPDGILLLCTPDVNVSIK